jgi:hypothetical protein
VHEQRATERFFECNDDVRQRRLRHAQQAARDIDGCSSIAADIHFH